MGSDSLSQGGLTAQVRTLHPNAALTPKIRRRMVGCVMEQGWSVAAAAERFQVDPKMVRKWRDPLPRGGPGWFAGSFQPAPELPVAHARRQALRGDRSAAPSAAAPAPSGPD